MSDLIVPVCGRCFEPVQFAPTPYCPWCHKFVGRPPAKPAKVRKARDPRCLKCGDPARTDVPYCTPCRDRIER